MRLNATLCVTVAVVTEFIAMASSVVARIAPENVAIVVNGDSEASKLFAEKYARLNDTADCCVVTTAAPRSPFAPTLSARLQLAIQRDPCALTPQKAFIAAGNSPS